jgi:hypothetical protein
VSALDQPLDRVNYFNGQRLEAADFRADQEYQMRVRRKLFSSLYSNGIVTGLEVTKHPTDPHKVTVAPGVALDFMGREIILLEATDVQVAGTPNATPGVIFGNFLVIAYAEQRVQPVSDGCTASPAGGGCGGGNLAWGAPTRVRAVPKLEMVDTWPNDQSGKIVLAQIGLKAGCQVSEIQSGVRRYAVAAKPPTVRPISLEGEKDINASNPKILYFHVDGGVPDTVTLYLRGAQFSTLFYTELGQHTHNPDLKVGQIPAVPDHTHTIDQIETDTQLPNNSLDLTAKTFGNAGDYALRLWKDDNIVTSDLTLLSSLVVTNSAHSHKLKAGASTGAAGGIAAVTPDVTLTIEPTGLVTPPPQASGARTTGQALGYVTKLAVLYDGQDITAQILKQLNGNDPANWPVNATLGDGSNTHALVVNGTGTIDLTQLGLDFTPGEHSLTFQVAAGGGQIKYNLYVA